MRVLVDNGKTLAGAEVEEEPLKKRVKGKVKAKGKGNAKAKQGATSTGPKSGIARIA